MMNLSTWTVVTRDQWKVIPYDQSTIMQITARAMADEVSLTSKQREAHRGKDAIFRRVHSEIIGPPEDDVFIDIPSENPPVMNVHAPVDDELDTILEDSDTPTLDQRGDSPSLEPTNTPTNQRGDVEVNSDSPTQAMGSEVAQVDMPNEEIVEIGGEIDHNVDPPQPQNDEDMHEDIHVVVENDLEENLNENDALGEEQEKKESLYNLRHPKRYPTPTVFLTDSAGSKVPPQSTMYAFTLIAHKMDIIHHMTASKALKTMRQPAIEAIVKELHNIWLKDVWVPVRVESLTTAERLKIIRSSMFLKEKYRGDSTFEKLKARLVAGGDMQDKQSLGEISSPVVSTTSVNIVAAIAAKECRKVFTVDIGSAFLNSDMSGENVLMKLDRTLSDIMCKMDNSYFPYVSSDGTLVVHLKKALYGCVKSSYLWYMTLSSFLGEIGFKANVYDRCVMNKFVKIGSKLVQCTVCWHVDDLMITCTDADIAQDVISSLRQRFCEISEHSGLIHNYLGAVFDFSTRGSVKISMPHHTKLIVNESGVTGYSEIPASSNLFDINDEAELLNTSDKEWFHSYVHRVMYLANRVNFVCLVTCAFLSSRTQAQNVQDKLKLIKLLQYLNKNQSLELILTPGDDFRVVQYTDAAYGVHSDGKSHTGTCILIGKGAIHARSVKQKIVTKSSTEAELVGLSDEASKGLWVNYFMEHQGYKMPPLVEYQDNLSTIVMSRKGYVNAQRTRHIKVRYFWIKDYIDVGELELTYTPTDSMLADALTKPLRPQIFVKMRDFLLNSMY